MHFNRMPLEDWFDRYQYEIDCDIGESGVKYRNLSDLGLNLENLGLRYGHHGGAPELRTLISEQYEGLKADRIVVTSGSSEANFGVIVSLVNDSDSVIVQYPNYPSLYEVPRSLGLSHHLFRSTFEEKFATDIGRLEELMKNRKTKLVTLTHPNNPTGSLISEQRLREIIELVESYDAFLLHDETYRELSFGKPPPPAATLSDHAISMTTMSKAYGLPGIRIGWVAGPKEVVEDIIAVREQVTICNNTLGEAIATSALKQKDQILKNVREHLLRNFEALKRWMATQGQLEWFEPQGGAVAFPRLKANASTEPLCRLLVTKYRTFTIPGYAFGMDRHLRIGFGGEAKELNEGLTRLGSAMNEMTMKPGLRA
jgi:aspartate/methionine/tyrosine aminotransferase